MACDLRTVEGCIHSPEVLGVSFLSFIDRILTYIQCDRRVWHQHRRRFASGIGKYAARTLGCQPGSWLSSHVQLFVGFACTGLSHVIGDYMIDPAFGWASPPFFIYQAAAIILEDAVISFGTSLGIVDALPARLVGYVWTFAWLIYSNNWFAGWQLMAGLGKHQMFPLSVVRPALEYVAATAGLDVLEIARHFVTKVWHSHSLCSITYRQSALYSGRP